MKIAICDDNELQLELTNELLKDIMAEDPKNCEICSFTSGRQLLESVRTGGDLTCIYWMCTFRILTAWK